MNNLFVNTTWDTGTNYGISPYKMTPEEIIQAACDTAESMKKYLTGVFSIPQGFAIPYFTSVGLDDLVTKVVEHKEKFKDVRVEDLQNTLGAFYIELDKYIKSSSANNSGTKQLSEYNDEAINILNKYDDYSIGAISYLYLTADGISTFSQKLFILGMCKYLEVVNKGNKLYSYLGISITNTKTMTLGDIIANAGLISCIRKALNIPKDYFSNHDVTASEIIKYLQEDK